MDTNALFILYYSAFTLCVFFYFCCAYSCRYKLASASNFAFVYAMIILALPGYYVADGSLNPVIDNGFNRGFDIQLYWIYFLFMPIVSIALIMGQLAGKRMFIRTMNRKKMDSTVNILFFISCIYCLLYLIWLRDIPVNNLLFSTSFNFTEVYMQRMIITHGLKYEENVPYIFMFWRNIAQYIMPALFYYFMITYKIKHRNILSIAFLFVYVLYLQIFTIEKAPFLYFVLGMLFLLYLQEQREKNDIKIKKINTLFKYSAGTIIIIICLAFLYKYFMNVQNEMWMSLFKRVVKQSASDYVQIDYVRQIGFLGFSGIKMPILSSLFNLEYINTSKYATSVLYSDAILGEAIGGAGGLSLANLYYIMGWYSLPVFFVFVFMFGLLDKIIINSIYNPINGESFYLNISFYAMCTLHYAISIGSSIWNVFAIPTVFSPPLIIIMIAYFMLIKMPYSNQKLPFANKIKQQSIP